MVRESGLCNAKGLKIPIQTKMNISKIQEMCKGTQDEKLVEFLKYGWPLGHDGREPPDEPTKNHSGVTRFPEETRQYLQSEKEKSRVTGPHDTKIFEGKNGISPLNSVPKKGSQDRRFVLDMSFPKNTGTSINAGIDKDWYLGEEVNLKYPTVDDLVDMIHRKQRLTDKPILLWKRDLKSCYRQWALCPGSVHLVGYKFEGKYWYDLVLSMGSSSAAQICQKITNMIRRMYSQNMGQEVVNFLDDFAGASIPEEADRDFSDLGELLKEIGVTEGLEKACAPSTLMTFLGILFNTVAMTLSLPPDKVDELTTQLNKWYNRDEATLRQMQSLIGSLNFACGIVRAGRIYMSRLINSIRGVNQGQKIKLTEQDKLDIAWWQEHIQIWNARSFMISDLWEVPGSVWTSDACESGIAGWSDPDYYSFELPNAFRELDINSLECLAIMVSLRKWAKKCVGKKLLLKCDNQVTVSIINSGASRAKFLQACLREIHHLCALHSVEIRAVYIKSKDNDISDSLSRMHTHPKYRERFETLTRDINTVRQEIYDADLNFHYTTL